MVRNVKGFTMVELMIVIAIIGILAVTLVPAFTGMQDRAKDTGTTSAVNSASVGIEAYASDANPSTYSTGTNNSLTSMTGTFTSLKADKLCSPVSASGGITSGGVGKGTCTGTTESFGYYPAKRTANNDTYIIWAGLITKSKGTLVSKVLTDGSSTGGIVNMNGGQSSLGMYAVHGANRQ